MQRFYLNPASNGRPDAGLTQRAKPLEDGRDVRSCWGRSGKAEDRSTLRFGEDGREQQELLANGAERGVAPGVGQTESLASHDEVVGQAEDLKVEGVGVKASRRNVTEPVVPFQFANEQFETRAVVVEAPDRLRRESEVGDVGVIAVAPEREEGGFRVGADECVPHGHDSTGFAPFVPVVPRLGDRAMVRQRTVPEAGDQALERRGQARNDGVLIVVLVEPREGARAVEAGVAPDPDLADRGRQDRTAVLKERDDLVGAGVAAGPEVAGPAEPRVRFVAEQGFVGRDAAAARVVSPGGPFLGAVDQQIGAVEIEDDAGARMRLLEQSPRQPVGQGAELASPRRGGMRQEAAQGGRIGKLRAAGEVLEDAVGTQGIRGFQAREAEDHGIEDRQDGLRRGVSGSDPGITQRFGEVLPQCKGPANTVLSAASIG